MGDLKPIGSEKLSGDAKLKRILELTYYQSTDSKSKSSEIVKESKTGVYGIVKEKDGYYVKKGLNESSLDYIGGLFMKNKNKFSSYNEALKKLEFLVEQELLTEATKYVLKQNKPEPKPQEEAPAPMPTTDTVPPPAPAPDAGAPADAGAMPPPAPEDAGDDEGQENPDEYLKIIQKMTGRLTQKLSTYQERLESKDIKYVLNMVLAAVDLDKMDEGDKDEIISKFEDDEDEGEPTSDFPTDDSGETPAPQDEEIDGIAKLDELISTPFDDDEFGDDDFNDDDSFLNDPEIGKAGKVAKKDIEKELGGLEDLGTDNPLNAKDEFTFDKELDNVGDEEFPLYNGEDRKKLSKGNDGFSMNEEDPMSDQGQMPNLSAETLEQDPNDPTSGPEGPAEGEVKELDIAELTDMVNSSVKETLSKYFS